MRFGLRVFILLQREPLRLDATVLLLICTARFFPAAAHRVEARGIHGVLLDQQPFDLRRALLAEINRAQPHLPDVGIAALLPEFFHE